MNYYNEKDPFCSEWLRSLIVAGKIPDGCVDSRDIREVSAADLEGFAQVHFFAGIAGWPLALQLAGWPEDRPIWTGSCPCQPFSTAGIAKGFNDERHLWPVMFELVRICRPPVVVGEQVASKVGLAWLDVVSADLEAQGYAFGAADLCAAGVGASHIRQRLFWAACDPNSYSQSTSAVDAEVAGVPSSVGVSRLDREDSPTVVCGGDGISSRMAKLRAFGNAVVPQVCAEFIRALVDYPSERNS